MISASPLTRPKTAGLGGAVCVLALILAPAAYGATVTRTVLSAVSSYTAAAGETNEVTVTRVGTSTVYTESAGNATTFVPSGSPGEQCTISGGGKVATCPDQPATTPGILIALGNLDDTVTLAGVTGVAPVTVNGDAGDDTVTGSDDADTLNGGANTDLISYSGRTADLTITLDGTANDGAATEADNVGADFETITGGSGGDTIRGANATSETINGGPGIDTLSGELSTATSSTVSDTINGDGGSFDRVDYGGRTTAVNVTLDAVANDGQSGENDSLGLGNDIERITGGSGSDTLTGNSGANSFDGGNGNDTVTGGDGNDSAFGEGGADTFVEGSSSNGGDYFSGDAANDTIDYSARTLPVTVNAATFGATDGEALEGDQVEPDLENIKTGSGNDTIQAASTANVPVVQAGAGADTVTGGTLADVIDGQEGNDVIDGQGGADNLDGGATDAGYDRITGGTSADDIDGGPGIDRAIFGASTGATSITLDDINNDTDGTGSTSENVRSTIESITGSATAADTLTGSCGNNVLAGQGGDDTLNGDPAVCASGYGGDFMGGGAGNDTMRGSVTPIATDGVDRVTYTANTAGQNTSITLDGLANDSDGQSGLDNVERDIEYLYGGPEVDVFNAGTGLLGALQGVSFWSGAGNDNLTGSDFNDFIDGEVGNDSINCAGGANDMYVIDAADPAPTNCETGT